METLLLFAPFVIGFCIGTTLSKAAQSFVDGQPFFGMLYLIVGAFGLALMVTHKATFTPFF